MRQKNYLWLLVVLLFAGNAVHAKSGGKEIHIPAKQVKENDFRKGGRFSHDYKMESENLVLFWESSFGKDPAGYVDKSRRFYPEELLREGERFFTYYVDKLKFADPETSQSARKKMIIWMFNDAETTAYGWGDEGVGMMWMRPCRAQSYPYCPLAHEMGHSFQYMVEADGSRGFGGHPLVEYTSQWMLWQVYSDWTTIEKYHLDAYMEQTHNSLLNGINQYHAPQFMEYWSNKHGLNIIARIWKEAQDKEDAVMTYQRITGLNQEEFCDEIYEAATHFVTWDVPRIKLVCRSYANEHSSKLEKRQAGWWRIAQERCPQSYGYNAIRLRVPEGSTSVQVEFKGIAGSEGFRGEHLDKAGWRYGFVASLKNGSCVYGDMCKAQNGQNGVETFVVPEETQYLWLVVVATPLEHTEYHRHWSELADRKGKEAQWPYEVRMQGTDILL